MALWRSSIFILAFIPVSSSCFATAAAQEQAQRLHLGPQFPLSFSRADSPKAGDLLYYECDSDLDGAILGGLIGGSPAVVGVILAGFDETGGERYIPWVYAGILGGIGGFLVGLGLDAADCNSQSLDETAETTENVGLYIEQGDP